MAIKTIVTTGNYVPTIKEMETIDDNFASVGNGTGFSLAEHADNAAAVTAGLAIGDLYTTTGTVHVVTA